MRRALVLFALGTVLLTAGCGGSHGSSTATAAQVNSGSCQESSRAGKPATQSCTFVLNDGRRLGCNRSIVGPAPSVPQLLRDGCRWLTPLQLSRSVRALIAKIDSARSCLTSKRMRAVGGAVLPPTPPGAAEPDGELVVTSRSPSFIAFYVDAARASRTLPALRRLDAGKHVVLERRGAVTIAWTQMPASEQRTVIWTCVSG